MHAAMARTFVLLAVCITLYAAGQQIASAQPAAAAQPVLSSMPPKRKGSMLAMRGKHSNTPPKRKRTALDVRGNHHVTQRALSLILKNVKSKGMVKATSPRSMTRTRHALACQDTPFGKLIQERSLATKKRRRHENTIPAPRGNVMGMLQRQQ